MTLEKDRREELHENAAELELFERFVDFFDFPDVERRTAEALAVHRLSGEPKSFEIDNDRNIHTAIVADTLTNTPRLASQMAKLNVEPARLNGGGVSMGDLFGNSLDRGEIGGPLNRIGIHTLIVEDAGELPHDLEIMLTSMGKSGVYATMRNGEYIDEAMYGGLLFMYTPLGGRFNEYEPAGDQLPFGNTVGDVMDLIVMNRAEKATRTEDRPDLAEEVDIQEYLRATQMLEPDMGEEVQEAVQDAVSDGQLSSLPVSVRGGVFAPTEEKLRHTLRRVAEARARARLSETVKESDVEFAIGSFEDMGDSLGWVSDRRRTQSVEPDEWFADNRMETLEEMAEEIDEPNVGVEIDEFVEGLEDRGLDKDGIDHWITRMMETGKVYQPQVGQIMPT